MVREDFDGNGRSFWSVSRSLTKTHRILSPVGLSELDLCNLLILKQYMQPIQLDSQTGTTNSYKQRLGLSVPVYRYLSRRVSTSCVVTEANPTVLNLYARLIFRSRHANRSKTKRLCLRYVRPRLCNLWLSELSKWAQWDALV